MNGVAVADRLTETTGQRSTVEGRRPGGEVGAYFVSANGRRYVMKWFERPGALADLTVTIERLQDLHASGFPMPRYEWPISIGDVVVVVQERVDRGRADDRVTPDLVEQLLSVSRLKIGATEPSDDWARFIRATLLEGADGSCLHRSLAEHSAVTRAIDPSIERRLWTEITSTGRVDAVAAYVAHMCIRQLDWQIRHHPDSIELWVDRAQRVRQRLG